MRDFQRQDIILQALGREGIVHVNKLARRFQVTPQTIRRDLALLREQGLVQRTHGGATRLMTTTHRDYQDRWRTLREEKQAIARQAAALIPDHCSVMLNIGTTTEQVARILTAHQGLLVISNNINIIQILSGSQHKLIIAGGVVRSGDGAIVGPEASSFLAGYKADYAVIGGSSIDPDGAVLDYDSQEVTVAQTILQNARTKILVADVSKFNQRAPVRICQVADLDYVVFDAPPPPTFALAAEQGGTKIVIASAIHEADHKLADESESSVQTHSPSA
ncbi:MAG: DeoR/GlpR family DNA-binding transcription regulator [Pseudomonadota bacterium]